MSKEETREQELRQTVAQLKDQLEEEKRARKRDHGDKVRELKATKEREQELSREAMDELKFKHQKDKTQEMNTLMERMTKDFKNQQKELLRKNEEEKQKLQKELEKERRNLKEQRKNLEKEFQKQTKLAQESEQKKMAQEMFDMSSHLNDLEERLKDTKAADRSKAEVIREIKAEHQVELESLSHSSKLNSRQQLEELKSSQRESREKDREISNNHERIRKLEADKDKLLDEVRTLRRAEAWAKSSVTPPSSLSPATSTGDITNQPHQYTQHERDLVLRNTELGYRIRQLETKNTELERYKHELKELLEKAKAEQKPLKDQLAKQGTRVNNLKATILDKEREVTQFTSENEELKKANLELLKEQTSQKRRLTQQMNQTHVQRMEHQKAVGKVTDLQKANKRLSIRVKDLEFQLRTRTSGLSGASSPSISINSLTSAMEDTAGADSSAVKYREMKSEYMKLKEHYKTLKTNYDKLEQKHRLAEQERLEIEAEISALRATPPDGRDSPYDIARSSSILSHNQTQIETFQSRVKELETYILEQEKLASEEKDQHARELSSLTEEREQLHERLQSVGREEKREAGVGEEEKKEKRRSGVKQELLEQLSEVERMNRRTSVGVKETQEKVEEFDESKNTMDETIQGLLKLETLSLEGDGEETEAGLENHESLIVMRRAQHTVIECRKLLESGKDASEVVDILSEVLSVDKPMSLLEDSYLALGQAVPVDSSTPSAHSSLLAEVTRLKKELSQKQEAAETAQSKVNSLQELVTKLEERLEENEKERESLISTWEHEITTLQTQLSQKETQLKRVRRVIPQGVTGQMHQELGQQVLHQLQQCKSSAEDMEGSEIIVSELRQLETTLHSLLHTVFPGVFQQMMSLPSSSSPAVPAPPHGEEGSPSQSVAAPTQNGFKVHSMSNETSTPSTTHPSDIISPSDVPQSSDLSSQHNINGLPHDKVVTPSLSTASGSPSGTPATQSPDVLPQIPPDSSGVEETDGQQLQPPTPPPSPQTASTPLPPPPPIQEVMVMREIPCEEITIPLSSFVQTTPTDSSHPHELQRKSSPHKPPVKEQLKSQLPAVELNHSNLVDQSEDGPEHVPSVTVEINEPDEEQAIIENKVPHVDGPLIDGLFTFTGGREYTQEDLDEVELATSGEYSVGETRSIGGWAGRDSSLSPSIPISPPPPPPPPLVENGSLPQPATGDSPSTLQTGKYNHLPSMEGNDGPSTSLYYPTPPEAPAGRQRLYGKEPTGVSPSSLMFHGKKRLRTQSMEQEELRDEEERSEERRRSGRMESVVEEKTTTNRDGKERLFVAILSYDPEAMCTTGRPDLELLFDEGAIIAVEGSVDESGFYRGSFQGRKGLVPAGFVQEMEVEDEHQRSRLLNQTLTRPHIPSLPPTPLNTPTSASRLNNSSSLFSPSGSFLSHTTPAVHSPLPPSSITVESTRQKNVVAVSWLPPTSPGSEVTGYHIFANKQLRASVTSHQNRVLLPDVSEVSPIVVGVASHDQYGRQSSVASTTYHPTPSSPSHQPPQESEQHRLCIVQVDYDPEKMSPSEFPDTELKVSEGNLLRCYTRDTEESGFIMAELGESNKRGLVPREFITEVYGPSSTDPNKYEWKSPPPETLPFSSKTMRAVYDYNSRQDSPNRDMGLELSFRNGDIITIYGSMDCDGFYTGEVGGAFGLVPSNFLNEIETEVTLREKQSAGRGGNRTLKRWELPPNMWTQMNGQEVHGLPMTQSDGRKKELTRPDHNLSGSEQHGSETSGEAKRRWSHNIVFKNPFSRKKSDSFL